MFSRTCKERLMSTLAFPERLRFSATICGNTIVGLCSNKRRYKEYPLTSCPCTMEVSSSGVGLDTLQVDFDDDVANDDDATDIPVVAPTRVNNNETDFPFTRSLRDEQVSAGESQGSHLVPSYTQVQTGEGIPSAPDLPVTWWTGVIIQGEDDYKLYTL